MAQPAMATLRPTATVILPQPTDSPYRATPSSTPRAWQVNVTLHDELPQVASANSRRWEACPITTDESADLDQRRAEGERLQAELPEGSNRIAHRPDDYAEGALGLTDWGPIGFLAGLGALVSRWLFRECAARHRESLRWSYFAASGSPPRQSGCSFDRVRQGSGFKERQRGGDAKPGPATSSRGAAIAEEPKV